MINTQSQPEPIRLRFSVDEYYKMIELGILRDYEKAEIIEGELIRKMPIGNRHAAVVNKLNRFFSRNIGDEVLISIQNPVRLSDFNEPEPDLVLADLSKYDGKRHPQPREVILIIEVSDLTLKYDRDVKLPLYSEAGIEEVWIINLQSNIVEIHQRPSNGLYQFVKIFNQGELIVSEIMPNLSLKVDDIFD